MLGDCKKQAVGCRGIRIRERLRRQAGAREREGMSAKQRSGGRNQIDKAVTFTNSFLGVIIRDKGETDVEWRSCGVSENVVLF